MEYPSLPHTLSRSVKLRSRPRVAGQSHLQTAAQ